MPFTENKKDIVLPDLIKQEVNVPEIETTLGEAGKRAFRYENIVGATFGNKSRGNWVRDPEFDYSKAFASLPEDYQLSKSISSKFADAENEDHFNAIKEQIDQETSDREYLAAAGWKGVIANLVAGILDPINLIPIGGVAYKVGKTGKKTYNVLNAGARTAMVGAGTISLQEAALHSQQESRTLGESAANISVGTLLSGVLGAGSYALLAKSARYPAFKKQLETELDITDFAEDVRRGVELQEKPGLSLSAAATPKKSREELLEENSLVYHSLFKPIMFQDPGLRLINSPVVSSRLALQEIAEFVPKLKKNLKGINTAKSVESERLLDEGRLADVILNNQDQFVKYRRRIGKDPNRLSRAEFNTEVSKALNRQGDSPIPEAAAAAAKVRKDILKHYGKEGLEIEGFFGDGKAVQDTLDTYFPRQFNRATIAANPAKFQKKIADYFKSEYSKAKRGTKARIYEDAIETLDESYFQRLALDVYDNVMGSSSSVLHDNVGLSSLPSFAKSRKLLMDNTEIEEFLEMDVDAVMTKYAKLMSSRTRLAKRFGMDFLDDNMQTGKSKIVQDIKEEYADLKAKVLDKPKELKKLKAQEEKDLADVFALRDRLLGTYGYSINPDSWAYRVQRQVKQYNVVTMLGDVLASSTPDLGKQVMVGGFSKFLGKGLRPLVKKLASPEFRKYKKLHAREMNRMGVALDLVNNGRVNAIGDIMDDFGRHTKFERGADYVNQKLITATGINHWNASLRQVAGGIIQSNMHDAMSAIAGNSASAKQIANLAKVGIDKQAARAIRAQIKKHGEVIDDLVFPNITKWGGSAEEIKVRVNELQKRFSEDINVIQSEVKTLTDTLANIDRLKNAQKQLTKTQDILNRSVITSGKVEFGEKEILRNELKLLRKFFRRPTTSKLARKSEKEALIAKTKRDQLVSLGKGLNKDINVKIEKLFRLNEKSSSAKKIIDSLNEVIPTLKDDIDSQLKEFEIKYQRGDKVKEALTEEINTRKAEISSKEKANLEELAAEELRLEAIPLGELYATAIRKEVDSTIVTPGVGTTPLWMSRNGLTLFGQFQSFAFSSMQKTLIPIVQDFDVKTVQGLSVMIGLGTLVAAYKRAARGDDMPDVKTLIQEGVDRSGTLAWLMDYNNRLEKLSQGNIGLSRILGTNATNKYYNYNNFAALGPTTGQVNNLMNVASGILSGNVNQSTVHSARRLLPLQTMIGVRQTLDLMEKEFNNTMGIPKN